MKIKKFHIKFIVIVLFPSLLFCLASCAYFNTYYNAMHYFKEGEKENKDNETGRPKTANYQKSLDSAARILEFYPGSKYVDDALLLMGKAYYEIQNYPKAKRKFEELLNNYPDSPLTYEARLYLGKTLIALRQPAQGTAMLNKLWIEEKVPREVRIESQRTQADYYFDQENYRQALLEYSKILKTARDKQIRADVQYQIGECHFELGEYEQAEQAYQKVLDEKPSRKRQFEAIYKRALTLQKRGDLEGALGICEKLLKKDIYFNYYKQVHLTKAGILTELKRYEEALDLYQRIIELYPRTETSAEASYRLGQIYLEVFWDFEKAEEFLSKVRTEQAQSEFVSDAQEKVGDLQYLKSLSFKMDSLKADIDTLQYRLEWIAEQASKAGPDSLQVDSLQPARPDTAEQVEEPSPGDTLSAPQSQIPPQLPSVIAKKGVQGPLPGGIPLHPFEPGMGPEAGAAIQPGVAKPIRLRPLPTDSAAVYDRLTQDYQAMAEVRYRLAEHLWSQFGNLDSARVLLTGLAEQAEYPDLQARALLSLYHLSEITSPDSAGPDSILERINQEFPGTEFDRWVRPKLGLEPLPEPVDSAAEHFRRAESLWTEDNLPQAAIREYLEVSRLYSDTEWGAKALFAAAWIQENVLEDIPAALASYDSLIAWFPESPYIDIARKKVAPPPPEVPDTTEALVDTTAVVKLAGALEPAPPGSGPPELIGGGEVLQNYIHQNHLYPTVAREAGIPGEVTVNFTVDTQGNPHKFNILREDPEGFDFGQMAIQALQGMTFRPGYRDGQYIEAPSTQIVRFIP